MDLSQFLSGNRSFKAFSYSNYSAPTSENFVLIATLTGPGIVQQVSSYTSYNFSGGKGDVDGYIVVDGVQSPTFGSYQNTSNTGGTTDIHYTGPFTFKDSLAVYAKLSPTSDRSGGVGVRAFLY